MDAFEILVIILSITLAIFLILAIVATVILIRILKKVESLSDRAEVIAMNVEDASAKFKSFAGPAAVISLIAKLSKLRK